MSIFSSFSRMKRSLYDEVKKVKNQNFLEAVLAGAAMVAYADGKIQPSEKQKLIQFVQNNESLKVFDTDTVISLFNKFIERMEFDPMIGAGECLKTIEKLKGKEDASLMIRVCCAIGAADGDFDENEKECVRLICRKLELDFSEFKL